MSWWQWVLLGLIVGMAVGFFGGLVALSIAIEKRLLKMEEADN